MTLVLIVQQTSVHKLIQYHCPKLNCNSFPTPWFKTRNLCTTTFLKWFLDIASNTSLHIPQKPAWFSKSAILLLDNETVGLGFTIIYLKETYFWVGVIHPTLKSIKAKVNYCSEIVEVVRFVNSKRGVGVTEFYVFVQWNMVLNRP